MSGRPKSMEQWQLEQGDTTGASVCVECGEGIAAGEVQTSPRGDLCGACMVQGAPLPDDAPAHGYDGIGYRVGDRVELHPGTDLWMRGARYGTVVGIVPTPDDRVRVELDRGPKVCGSEDTFRLIGRGC